MCGVVKIRVQTTSLHGYSLLARNCFKLSKFSNFEKCFQKETKPIF